MCGFGDFSGLKFVHYANCVPGAEQPLYIDMMFDVKQSPLPAEC